MELKKKALEESASKNTVSTTTSSKYPLSFSSSKSYENYLVWKAKSAYDHSVYLQTEDDKSKGIQFHWKIHSDAGTIQIGVAVKNDSQQGWVEIGFSDHGGRRGADIIYFTRTDKASLSLIDGYVLDDIDEKPLVDKKQDWELIDHSITDDGYLIFEAKRALDTKDNFDKPLIDDSEALAANHIIIGAWGQSPNNVYYHESNKVKAHIQLFQSLEMGSNTEMLLQQLSSKSDGSGTIKVPNYEIPSDKTTYTRVCYDIEEIFGYSPSMEAKYITGFRNKIGSKYLHHMGFAFNDKSTGKGSGRMTTWSLNAPLIRILADDVGKNIGGADNFDQICIFMHFDNPDQATGVIDDTEIQLFYINSPRKYSMGFLPILSQSTGSSVGSGLSQWTFNCDSPFDQPQLEQDEITIIQTYLHAHKHAKRVVSQVVRDGEVIHELSADYWEFAETSDVEPVHRPYKVRKTDSLRTICYFNTTSDIVWDQGSDDEMCNSFHVIYFEANSPSALPDFGLTCVMLEAQEKIQLTDASQLNRQFGRE